jgi:plasmid stability protein
MANMNIRNFGDALLQNARIEAAKRHTTLREFVIAAVEKSADDKQLAVPSEPQTDAPENGSESEESEKPPVRSGVQSMEMWNSIPLPGGNVAVLVEIPESYLRRPPFGT